MNVELHIEELVLQGFAGREGERIGRAIERELSRLLIEKGVPLSLVQGGEVVQLNGGAFEVKLGSSAESIGRQVAQALYGGFGE